MGFNSAFKGLTQWCWILFENLTDVQPARFPRNPNLALRSDSDKSNAPFSLTVSVQLPSHPCLMSTRVMSFFQTYAFLISPTATYPPDSSHQPSLLRSILESSTSLIVTSPEHPFYFYLFIYLFIALRSLFFKRLHVRVTLGSRPAKMRYMHIFTFVYPLIFLLTLL
jgi:hypothetical protein